MTAHHSPGDAESSTSSARQDPADWVRRIADGPQADHLVHLRRTPARDADTSAWPDWVDPSVYAAFAGTGLTSLWSHQAATAQLAREGQHVVCATGTASGKSLGYLLPVLTAIADGASAPTGRGVTALYLSPTKALAADQLDRIERLAIPGLRAATYDGDTPSDERRWIREHAQYVLTNPDLVHHSLLPAHPAWAPFLRALKYIVVDECHIYRGVFGAHISAVLRRLLRVAARYKASPTVVFASATVADPAEHAARLIGEPVVAVTDDGSPREARTFALWEPPVDDEGARRGAIGEAAGLLADLVEADVQTVAFARSRVGVEALATAATRHVPGGPTRRVAAYRGGYLPEERRELEAQLRSRDLLGLAATNALELGVDIAGLDAVLMAGWPGTRASLWQQAGRAGRRGTESLAVLIAGDDPLDHYLVHHPEVIFDAPVEASVLDPANPHVLTPHLAAAAAELPLTQADTRWFGPQVPDLARALEAKKILRRRPTGWYWARPDRAADHVALRGVGRQVSLVESGTGRVLGTVDEARSHSAAHPGAVYIHQGRPHVVTHLDLEDGTAVVVPGDPGWTTQARTRSEFTIIEELDRRPIVPGHPTEVVLGKVEVTSQVTSFLRRLPGGEVLGEHPLDLPVRTLPTVATWWTLTEEQLATAGVDETDVPGSLHAAEHAGIGLLPLIATCDRWDIGGVSTALHPDTGLPTVMVYDGYPGGAGIAARGYERAERWWRATRAAIAECRCADGCPACIQSPKCGNGNNPLSKAGAIRVLDALLGSTPGS